MTRVLPEARLGCGVGEHEQLHLAEVVARHTQVLQGVRSMSNSTLVTQRAPRCGGQWFVIVHTQPKRGGNMDTYACGVAVDTVDVGEVHLGRPNTLDA